MKWQPFSLLGKRVGFRLESRFLSLPCLPTNVAFDRRGGEVQVGIGGREGLVLLPVFGIRHTNRQKRGHVCWGGSGGGCCPRGKGDHYLQSAHSARPRGRGFHSSKPADAAVSLGPSAGSEKWQRGFFFFILCV